MRPTRYRELLPWEASPVEALEEGPPKLSRGRISQQSLRHRADVLSKPRVTKPGGLASAYLVALLPPADGTSSTRSGRVGLTCLNFRIHSDTLFERTVSVWLASLAARLASAHASPAARNSQRSPSPPMRAANIRPDPMAARTSRRDMTASSEPRTCASSDVWRRWATRRESRNAHAADSQG